MNQESQLRFVAVLLFLLTVAAVVFAGFNLQKERQFAVPDDGAWWVERGGGLFAARVDPNGPATKGGIKSGDQLISVNGQDVRNTPGLVRQLYRAGVLGEHAEVRTIRNERRAEWKALSAFDRVSSDRAHLRTHDDRILPAARRRDTLELFWPPRT